MGGKITLTEPEHINGASDVAMSDDPNASSQAVMVTTSNIRVRMVTTTTHQLMLLLLLPVLHPSLDAAGSITNNIDE